MQQLFTDVKNPRRLLAVIVLGVGLFALTRLAGEAQAVTGMSPSGRLQFTKGFEPFYFPGNSQLTAVTGRSCTINKMSSSSALIITYHENVSSVGAPGNHRFSSIHLYLNGVHMSGRQLYVPNPNEPLPTLACLPKSSILPLQFATCTTCCCNAGMCSWSS